MPATASAERGAGGTTAGGGRRGPTKSQMAETGAVRRYLAGLAQRTRQEDPERIRKRLADLEVRSGAASAIERLGLVQQRLDLEGRLRDAEAAVSAAGNGLEAAFVDVAASYSERKGISWQAWREVGVPAAVLARAQVPRSRT